MPFIGTAGRRQAPGTGAVFPQQVDGYDLYIRRDDVINVIVDIAYIRRDDVVNVIVDIAYIMVLMKHALRVRDVCHAS